MVPGKTTKLLAILSALLFFSFPSARAHADDITPRAAPVAPGQAPPSDGALDDTFGIGGKVVTDIRSSSDAVRGMALQPDGKIVVVGSSHAPLGTPRYVLAVARYNADGSLDTSFGIGGKVTTAFGTDDVTANAVALQSDGKIIAAGYATPDNYAPATRLALARYNPDGSLDVTFGDGSGRVTTAVRPTGGGDARIEAIVIQPDGKIVVGGHVVAEYATSLRVALMARYNPDGTLDTTFATTGVLRESYGGSCANSSSAIHALALQPDGKIVVTGYAVRDCPARQRFAVARYKTDGTRDVTFDEDGLVTTFDLIGGRKGWVGGAAVLVQPDGKITLTGSTGTAVSSGAAQFALLRLLPDGAVDTSFGSLGIVTRMVGAGSEAYAVQLQADGKLVVAGDALVGTQRAFAMARFNGDGSSDASFGTDGAVITDISAQDDGANSLAILPDGKLLLAGFSNGAAGNSGEFALARYSGTNPRPLAVNAVRSRIGGNTGQITVTVFGAGFQPGTGVRLVCAAQPDIAGTAVRVKGPTSLLAVFELDGAAPGSCDVVVTNPDGASATLAGGFVVVPGSAGKPWIDVIGRTTVRAGSTESMYLHLGNSGNVDAVVPFWVSFHLDSNGIPQGRLRFNPYHGPLGPDAGEINYEEVPLFFDRVDSATGSERVFPMLIYIPAGGDVLLPVSLSSLCTGDQAMKVGIGGPMDALTNRPTVGCMLDIANLLGGFVPGHACVNGPLQFLLHTALQDQVGNPVSLSSFLVSDVMMVAKCAASFYPPAAVAVAVVDTLITAYGTAESCGQVMGAWDEDARPGVNFNCVFSKDPNDKVGSRGFGAQGYLTGNGPLAYSVFFENVPSATAPAQDIVITDQLDPALLDLSTFSLGPITIGQKLLTPPAGLSEFTGDLDLRPENDMIARVTARLELATGLVRWTFRSIDPSTGLPTTDPLAGSLPPNVNSPEGQGSVVFTVSPKEDLPTGTAITNQASIVFDDNEPIETPVWLNTIDRTHPVSQILALAPVQPTAVFPVHWSGNDGGSGVKHFSVLVSDGAGPFTVWLNRTTATSGVFTGQNGHTYRFFSVAEDHVGNMEPAKTDGEAATVVDIRDAVAPVTTAGHVPPANAAGWHAQDFTVTLTAIDNTGGSGVSAITYSASGATVIPTTIRSGSSVSIPLTTEGSTTITFSATDNAGNSETVQTMTVGLDKTPPTIIGTRAPLPNASGWNNTNVIVSFACSDTLSGLAAGSPPANTTLGHGASQSASGTCTDVAGNSASAVVGGINIDLVPPVVTVTGFTDGAIYTASTVPSAACDTTDALSGVATTAIVTLSGGTNGVGKFTATCSGASDAAGNVAPGASASYYIGYDFVGFLPPLRAGQGSYSGSYKLGQTIPVKWQIVSADGFVSDLSAVRAIQVVALGECAADDGPASDLKTRGATELRYDAADNQFIYNWNTSGLRSGCYEIRLLLDNTGPAHTTIVNLRR